MTGCIKCGKSFTHAGRTFKYLKKPIGIQVVCDAFICNGDIPHVFVAISYQTLAEVRDNSKDKRQAMKKEQLPTNPNAGLPYTKRTDGIMTDDEIRIRDKVKADMAKAGLL